MTGITLSDMDFHKRIEEKYLKFKITPSGFPSLIFYKDPDYQKRDIKIGILLRLHFDIRNEAFAAWNNILVMKGRMEIPQIMNKNDLSAIFLVFNEKVIISHQAVMSRLQRMLTIPGSASPPASWHPASTVSQLFLAAYEFGQKVNGFSDLRITGSVRTERKSPVLISGTAHQPGRIAMNTYDISGSGAHDNHPEKGQVLKYQWSPHHKPEQIRMLSRHDPVRFNVSRLNTLNQAQYVSNIFSGEPDIYHVDHIPVIVPQIRKMMSLFKQGQSTVKDHNKEYNPLFGSELIIATVRLLLNNKKITGAISHPEVYTISSPVWLANGYRNQVEIFMQGKNTGFDKKAQNMSSQNLTDFKRATSMNSIDTDLVYTHDQRKIENEVVEIKKIIEETKREISDKKEIQMTEKNVDMDALRRININQISDQVYQMIDRKIKIEAERRGIL